MAMSRSPVQVFSLVLGAVYLLIGLAGFAVAGLDDFAAPPVTAP